MNKDQDLKELVKENVFSKVRKLAKDAWKTSKEVKKQAPAVIKRETRETKIAAKILLRILKRKDVTNEELKFLKAQGGDVAKALGLIAGGVVSIPLTVGLVAFLEKKGINVLPQAREELTEGEVILMEEALNEVEKEIRQKYNLPVPNDIMAMKDLFSKAGFELFIVGGAIRDHIRGEKIKDYDLATDASTDQIVAILQRAGGYEFTEAGEKFSVVHVNTPDHVRGTEIGTYEIAPFREDFAGETGDHSKPVIKYSTIDKDAERRDLTINALYYDLDTGEIVDFVGGLEDLKNGVVRTVGDATQRFDEHRIRILRAIRFAARMGQPLHPDAIASIKADNDLRESGEAILKEFEKGIKQAKVTGEYLALLAEFNLFPQVLPSINVDVKNMTGNNEKNFIAVVASIARHNNPIKLHKALMAAKYSSSVANGVSFIVGFNSNVNEQTASAIRRKVTSNPDVLQARKEQIRLGIKHGIIDQKLGNAFLQYLGATPLSGADAEAAGISKGTEMGRWLKQKEAEIFLSFL